MRATGMVRKIDDLGRLCIPKELRRTSGIEDGDPIEIFTDNDGVIVLKKYEPFCTFCGSSDEVRDFRGKNVCGKCAREAGEMAKK